MKRMERFLKKVAPADANGCEKWLGGLDADGYGYFLWPGGTRAHRFAWAESNGGAIPEGRHILHRCDNPACVARAHLYLGDHDANMADKVFRKRQARGEHLRVNKITSGDVALIREATGTQASIGIRFGLHQTTVSRIKNNHLWSHL